MVNSISLRLSLSAADIKQLVPNWPDPLIEDYLQILADLEKIITDLNVALTDIEELFADYGNINADLSGVRGTVSKVRSKVNRLEKVIDGLDGLISEVGQENSSALLLKTRSKIVQFSRDAKSWFPSKAALLKIEGAGAANPLVLNGYNISTVARTGIGVYVVTIQQDTYFTGNVLAGSVFSLSKKIAPLTSSFDIEVSVTGANTFEIRVYQLAVAGLMIARNLYDFAAGDFVQVQALYSINSNLPPR